jgi:hypothetical protein
MPGSAHSNVLKIAISAHNMINRFALWQYFLFPAFKSAIASGLKSFGMKTDLFEQPDQFVAFFGTQDLSDPFKSGFMDIIGPLDDLTAGFCQMDIENSAVRYILYSSDKPSAFQAVDGVSHRTAGHQYYMLDVTT